ncbi:hypothetical protein ARMGADRAFT_883521, partial [Armillaria gallica]
LVEAQQGLHFRANHATLEQLESFDLGEMGIKMKSIAPLTWEMLAALLDPNTEWRRHWEVDEVDMDCSSSDSSVSSSEDEFIWEDIDLDELDAGDIEDDAALENNTFPTASIDKQVMILSVLGHSSNQRFNAFQSVMGFFLESKQCPEIILKTVAHMGISISVKSIARMVNLLSKKA